MALVAALALSRAALAETFYADPHNYRDYVGRLRPGDTLVLQPGDYRGGLSLHGLQGEPGKPITIRGVDHAAGVATLHGRPGANTVSLKNAAYLVIRSLVLDGGGLEVDAVKAEGTSRFAHDITLEDLTIVNHGADQQIVGISTKCPAWNWVIRRNVILGAGTGMYLGNSDGNAPFVDGLIEYNYVADTVGYNLQIKQQLPRREVEGMPHRSTGTIIRHNVFSKANGGSDGPMARPNVLLGHFPSGGSGSDDWYFVYGNVFYQNPHESLFQAEGNVAAYSNIFLNHYGDAIRIQPHKGLPRRVVIDHNTVVARERGILVAGGDRRFLQSVTANAVFASQPLVGGDQAANATGSYPDAAEHLTAPFLPPGQADFAPKRGRMPPVEDPRRDTAFPDWSGDFFGRPRSGQSAGAVDGGTPPPWRFSLGRQPAKNR